VEKKEEGGRFVLLRSLETKTRKKRRRRKNGRAAQKRNTTSETQRLKEGGLGAWGSGLLAAESPVEKIGKAGNQGNTNHDTDHNHSNLPATEAISAGGGIQRSGACENRLVLSI